MVLAPGSAPAGTVRRTRRFDEWRTAIREDFVALDLAPERDIGEFVGSVTSTTLAHLQVSRVCSVTQHCRRTPSLARADDERYLQIGMVTRGRAVLEQDGRRALLAGGDFAIYETDRPFTWHLSGDWRLDVLTWPRDGVGLADGESAAVTATRFDGREGLGGLVGAMLRGLVAAPPRISTPGAARLADETAELVATLALERAGGPPTLGRARQDLVRAVCDHIDARLGDPTLSPASIAQAHFMSTRQLHRLFAAGGETVARRIRRLRLERARRDLVDPRTGSVTEVARRWAFADLPTFSRAFRGAYGLSPSEYRARHLR